MERKVEFDFPGREPACIIDSYIRRFRHGLEGEKIHSKAAIALVDEIFETLKEFKTFPDHDDEIVTLFLEAPKGTIDEFGDYEELHEMGGYDTYEEFVEDWEWRCPNESKWYFFESIKTDFGYKAIFLGHRGMIACDPRDEYYGKTPDWMEEYIHPYLKWLNSALKKAIEMLKAGTYNDYVSKYLDYESRTGTIPRNDFWKVFPESKEDYFSDISEEDVKEFVDLVKRGIGVNDRQERLDKMTLGLYLDACALGYRANFPEEASLTPRELYKKHADGRDDGLLKLKEDDPEAYENWDPNSDENFNGHHPWEVIPGHSFSRLLLRPNKDDKGYYFSLNGGSYGTSVIAIKFFLAIHRAGYPIRLWDAEELANRCLGIDKIGIVPNGVFTQYCESWFPGESIADFINFHYEEDKDLLPYIEWKEIDKVELK